MKVNFFLEASKSEGLKLEWEVDNNNLNNRVFISIINRGSLDEGESSEGSEALKLEVEDNGSYIVSSEEISNFSNGNRLDINVSRVNVYSVNGNHVAFSHTNFVSAKVVE